MQPHSRRTLFNGAPTAASAPAQELRALHIANGGGIEQSILVAAPPR
jgi:hypothetical protein